VGKSDLGITLCFQKNSETGVDRQAKCKYWACLYHEIRKSATGS